MSNFVPKTTKMAKYLQTVAMRREDLKATHHRVLHILREMNTTIQIIAALTGIKEAKVYSAVGDLHEWGLASITETRKTGARQKHIWGLHDDFRAVNKVPTYPSVTQEASMVVASKKAGRKLEMDEVAVALWGNQEMAYRGHSATLVDIATGLKKTPIPSQQLGGAEARRQSAVDRNVGYIDEYGVIHTAAGKEWSLEDFAADEEE